MEKLIALDETEIAILLQCLKFWKLNLHLTDADTYMSECKTQIDCLLQKLLI